MKNFVEEARAKKLLYFIKKSFDLVYVVIIHILHQVYSTCPLTLDRYVIQCCILARYKILLPSNGIMGNDLVTLTQKNLNEYIP